MASETRLDKACRWAIEGARSFSSVQGEPVHVPRRPDTVLHRRSWFGCDGVNAGYTPSGISALLENQIAEGFRARLVRALVPTYSHKLKFINVKHACEILQALGNGQDKFRWKAFDISCCYCWTPDQLSKNGKNLNCDVTCWYATSISPINFTGGPPNKWQIYVGSLFTLLIDRLAATVLLGGMESLNGIIQPKDNYKLRGSHASIN